jgi:hypothetical protein
LNFISSTYDIGTPTTVVVLPQILASGLARHHPKNGVFLVCQSFFKHPERPTIDMVRSVNIAPVLAKFFPSNEPMDRVVDVFANMACQHVNHSGQVQSIGQQ